MSNTARNCRGRFNEAIDQAIVESIGFFSAQVDQARNLFLGMLGHDMRSLLNAILMTAQYLAALNAGAEVSDAATRLISSGASMKGLLDQAFNIFRNLTSIQASSIGYAHSTCSLYNSFLPPVLTS